MNYECHITCDIKDGPVAEGVARELHWKTSQIERDPVLGEASYFYLTTHSKDQNEMYARMNRATAALKDKGVMIIREKIEKIVFDTKTKVSDDAFVTIPVDPVFRTAGAVKRFHIMRTIRTQTVAEHSHGVATLVMLCNPDCSATVLKAALTHDFHEEATGDMPSTAKWQFPKLAEAMAECEAAWEEENGLRWNLTREEQELLKFCDYLELLHYSKEEFTMGNRYALRPLQNIIAVLDKLTPPTPAAMDLYGSARREAFQLINTVREVV